jgi:hypothetical protein
MAQFTKAIIMKVKSMEVEDSHLQMDQFTKAHFI